jgi:small-conductance mechanosensitive channel
MVRLCFWLLLAVPLAVAPWHAAYAQQQPASQPAAQSAPQATTPFGTLSPEQARAALETLNDPRKRAAFAATLEALTKGQPGQPAPAAAAPAPPGPAPAAPGPAGQPSAPAAPAPSAGIPITLEPNSLGAQVLLSASAFLSRTSNDLPRLLKTMQSLPLLWGWTVVMVTNPLGQRLLADAGWRLAVVLVVALAVAQALRIVLRAPMARLVSLGQLLPPPELAEEVEDPQDRAERGATEPPPSRVSEPDPARAGRRIRLGLARFVLQMVPIVGLVVAGHMAAGSPLGGTEGSRLVILAVLDAIGACLSLLAVMTLLFSPDPPGLQVLPLRPSAGAYLIRWTRRLILIAVPGYTIGEVALLLGLSPPAHDALQKAVGLALMICLAVIVVQRRRPVRRWLSAPVGATGLVARSRNALARRWDGIALFFLAAIWLAWTLQAPDAVSRIIWYFAVTAAVVMAAGIARLTVIGLLAGLRPPAVPTAASVAPVNPVRVRLGVYQPVLRQVATVLINLIAFLTLLQLYGLDGLRWLLTSDIGHRIASGIGTLGVTICLAFAVWEGVNIAIQTHLEKLRQEAQTARSARMRTLLPLIQTSLAITVVVVAGLMVLSEIGVNIGPLLAGAGIVGVAIGFGSQKLVQDVITGVFLLLENTMQVGDVVKVGDQSGLVESLSVRTIRLRTEDGSVVVIPFSAVTTVINMTRDYSRAVITANVAADEDVDRVIETMRAIVREMREETAWSTIILDELEVWGLDRITDTALQIKCRVMCTPFGRWPVGREFNRRLKARFEVVGISTAFSALRLPPPAAPAPEPAPQQAVPQQAEDLVAGQ